MNKDIRLTIHTKDLEFLNKLFDNQKLTKGVKVNIQDNVELFIDSIKLKPSMTNTEIILNVIISIESSIFAAYLKDIFDILSNKGKSSIKNSSSKKTMTKKEFEEYLNEIIKKN